MLYTIPIEDKNKRLDKFLVEKISDLSRSQIQKMIKSGGVLVNNKKPSVHQFLKEGDAVSSPPLTKGRLGGVEKSTSPVPSPQQVRGNLFPRRGTAVQPKIIYEDENILIIDKPAGLLTHPRAPELKNQEPTVAGWLTKKYPQIKTVGDNPKLRPGIVHRLDKEASGLMVMAKTPAAFEHLKKQFHDRQIKKEYLALVYGQLKSDYGKIEFPVGRAEKGGRMAARAQGEEGKPSLTEFEVIERRKNCALVKVFPQTGRTHQIRVHFFALGHPLVGDPLYQTKGYKEIPSERMMLHAHKITFKNLEGKDLTFTAPVPSEFK